MEVLGALCCGLPTLVALTATYALAPKLRPFIGGLVICGVAFVGIGVSVALYDEFRNGGVIQAIDANDPVRLRRELEGGADPNTRTEFVDHTITALDYAERNPGKEKCIKVLKEFGAKNSPDRPW